MRGLGLVGAGGGRFPPLPTVGDLLRLFQLKAKKQLAQNFLLDLNVTRRMVREAGRIGGGQVCEIGPGPGGLTRAILEQGPSRLCLVEKDGRFLHMMRGLRDAYAGLGPTKIRLVHADVLRWDLGSMWEEGGPGMSPDWTWEDPPPNCHIIANLPFNVATPLLIRCLRLISEREGPWRAGRVSLTLVLQEEVVERMVAGLGSDSRCRLSAITQLWSNPRLAFRINAQAFVPVPKVNAAVVHVEPLPEPIVRLPFPVVEKFCRHLFHYPNKHVIKAAMTLYPAALAGHHANELFRIARVDPTLTASQVSNEEIRDMCHVYYEQCKQTAGLYLFDYRAPKPLEVLAGLPSAYPPVYPWAEEEEMEESQAHQSRTPIISLAQAATELQTSPSLSSSTLS